MMEALATILIVVLRALVPALLETSGASAEDASPATELRGRLRRRIRDIWSGVGRLAVLAFCLCALSGCVTRTIYVPDGTPVRLRETIPRAKVWVIKKGGKPVPTEMDLPAGWYCLPDPGEREED